MHLRTKSVDKNYQMSFYRNNEEELRTSKMDSDKK